MQKLIFSKEQIRQNIQAMPKKAKCLTKDEIRQRIERLVALSPPNALRR